MEFLVQSGRIYQVDEKGKTVAEVTFPEEIPGVLNLNHTFVDESLRGQGVAGKLIQAVVDYAKAQGKQISPTCSYAVKWFEKHGEYQSLLNKSKL